MFEIGSSLREARMRNGYDLAEVEAATKIRTKYLKALEDEQFELLPAQTYIKGFLRSYAEYLGLDGELYVDEYNSRYGGDEGEEPILRSRPQRRQSRAQRRVESRILLLALVGILTATALVLIAWQWGDADESRIPNLDAVSPTPSVQSPPVPSGQPASEPAAPVELLLSAVRGNSWVAVRMGSGAGATVFEGTIERGRSMRFSGRKLWLNVARPANLAARLNGKAVAVPGRSAPIVVVATPKALRPAAGA